MKAVYVNAVGVAAPGLEGWLKAKEVLVGRQAYDPLPLEKYKSPLLPPNERRRATELVRLAFRACEDALSESIDAAEMASVFASAGGDYHIFDQICRALKAPERAVSPTQFHNSVHNAAAGYWGIATKSQAASTSLSAYDATFAAGLFESIMQLTIDGVDILYTAFDVVPPMPLLEKREITAPFAVAFVLSLNKTGCTIAQLTARLVDGPVADSLGGGEILEMIRLGNPSARAVPMLEIIAAKRAAELFFTMPGEQVALKVSVSPC